MTVTGAPESERWEAGGPFDSTQALISFLVENGYGRKKRDGTFELFQGGRDFLLCAIAVDTAALRRRGAA